MKVTITNRPGTAKKGPPPPEEPAFEAKRHEPHRYAPHQPHRRIAHEAKPYRPYGHPDHPYYWPSHPLYKKPKTSPSREAPEHSSDAADFLEENKGRLPRFEVSPERHLNGVLVEIDGADADALFEALENKGFSFDYDEDESFKKCDNCGMLYDPTELDDTMTCQRCGKKAKRVRPPEA